MTVLYTLDENGSRQKCSGHAGHNDAIWLGEMLNSRNAGDAPAEKSQVGPRHPLSRMPPFAHGALDAKEQRTHFAPRPHLRVRAGYWPGLGTPHKTLS